MTSEPPPTAARGARKRDPFAELADAIERCWLSKFGRVPVVAEVVIARIRRGNG